MKINTDSLVLLQADFQENMQLKFQTIEFLVTFSPVASNCNGNGNFQHDTWGPNNHFKYLVSKLAFVTERIASNLGTKQNTKPISAQGLAKVPYSLSEKW